MHPRQLLLKKMGIEVLKLLRNLTQSESQMPTDDRTDTSDFQTGVFKNGDFQKNLRNLCHLRASAIQTVSDQAPLILWL